ncbi:MAG: hypothetical protein BMS9Abin37_0796 [Acidobacteriota bacterium]|nr:MAG: hypothetical protein BMS9Abin37_0796 [Acidobacteriota bacterium]
MLTIVYRGRPGNTEWQYKTVISKKPPERWLADRLEAIDLGKHPRLDVNILFAREISQEEAEALEKALEEDD